MKTNNKTNNTETELEAIRHAIQRKAHVSLYERKNDDAKYNAQRNLIGRTHYVDEDTLSFHKSRVLIARAEFGGLLFYIINSDAADMDNTKRVFRGVVFDVFGTVLDRPTLEEGFSTRAGAEKRVDELQIDLVAHYRAAIGQQIRSREREVEEFKAALEAISLSAEAKETATAGK